MDHPNATECSSKGAKKRRRFARPSKDKKKHKKPYSISNYKGKKIVLLVGSGDFSYPRGLLLACGKDKGLRRIRVIATCYDSFDEVRQKYPVNSCYELSTTFEKNVRMVENVDATLLSMTLPGDLKSVYFDAIVFHFPHTGNQRTHLNRNLVREFLASAGPRLRRVGGEIHVTLKQVAPYKFWNVSEYAEEAGLILKEVLPFESSKWPGYKHATTLASDATIQSVDTSHSLTYIFVPGPSLLAINAKKKREVSEKEWWQERHGKECGKPQVDHMEEEADVASCVNYHGNEFTLHLRKRKKRAEASRFFSPEKLVSTDDVGLCKRHAFWDSDSTKWGDDGASNNSTEWFTVADAGEDQKYRRALGKLGN